MNEINASPGVRLILPFVAPPLATEAKGQTQSQTNLQGDRVEVSAAGAALARIENEGVMRFQKVAQVRSDIQAGTYDVEGKLDAVLDRILDDVLA